MLLSKNLTSSPPSRGTFPIQPSQPPPRTALVPSLGSFPEMPTKELSAGEVNKPFLNNPLNLIESSPNPPLFCNYYGLSTQPNQGLASPPSSWLKANLIKLTSTKTNPSSLVETFHRWQERLRRHPIQEHLVDMDCKSDSDACDMVLKKLPKQLGGESMRGCVQSVRNAFEMEMFEEVSERERVFEALSSFFPPPFPPSIFFAYLKYRITLIVEGGRPTPPPHPPILRCARLSAAVEGCRERAKRSSFL